MADAPTHSDQPTPIAPGDRGLVERYWRRNVRLMGGLLAIWAAVSLGAGVLFADTLNAYRRVKDHAQNIAEALAGEK